MGYSAYIEQFMYKLKFFYSPYPSDILYFDDWSQIV